MIPIPILIPTKNGIITALIHIEHVLFRLDEQASLEVLVKLVLRFELILHNRLHLGICAGFVWLAVAVD